MTGSPRQSGEAIALKERGRPAHIQSKGRHWDANECKAEGKPLRQRKSFRVRAASLTSFHFILASATLQAERINWFCDPNQTNLDASGAPMDAGFTFELGVFANGFVPTSSNMAEWETHWNAAQTTSYVPETGSFSDTFQIASNASPFLVGTPGWIFGKRDQFGVREWLLFRGAGWTWPAPNPVNPFPILWNVNAASQVPFGTVNTSGSPFLMQAAYLDGPPGLLSYDVWKATTLAGEPLDGPDDDPDGDGTPNLLEFVFGSDPQIAQAPVDLKPTFVLGRLQVDIPRRADRDAVVVVEVSSDLLTWQSGPDHVEIISDEVLRLVVRDRTPIQSAPGGRRFIRVNATLP